MPYAWSLNSSINNLVLHDTWTITNRRVKILVSSFQDTTLRIWVLKSAYNYFKDMRNRYNADVKSSPTNSYENVINDQVRWQFGQLKSELQKLTLTECVTDLNQQIKMIIFKINLTTFKVRVIFLRQLGQ